MTWLPIIVFPGIEVFAPIPDSSPISTLRPDAKLTFLLIVRMLPHFLKMCLTQNTLNLLLTPPNWSYNTIRVRKILSNTIIKSQKENLTQSKFFTFNLHIRVYIYLFFVKSKNCCATFSMR